MGSCSGWSFVAFEPNLSLFGKNETSKISNPESGSAGESHPHAPTDPCVNLPIHMAPVSLPLEASRPQADVKRNPAPPSFLVEHRLLQADSSLLLQPHYRTFNTTTG